MKLRVGYRDITVLPLSRAEGVEMSALGYYDADPGIIRIDPTITPQEQARVLLHEAIHAVWHIYRLPSTLGEEAACRALDGPLAALLRDNHELLGETFHALLSVRPLVREPAP